MNKFLKLFNYLLAENRPLMSVLSDVAYTAMDIKDERISDLCAGYVTSDKYLKQIHTANGLWIFADLIKAYDFGAVSRRVYVAQDRIVITDADDNEIESIDLVTRCLQTILEGREQ